MSRLVFSSLEQRFSLFKISSQFKKPPSSSGRLPCVHCTRHYRARKPFWLPMAKTKMFKIPKHPEVPKNEEVELLRLTFVYKTQTKSLRQYFKEKLASQTTAPEVIEERKVKELEEHKECVKINDSWNAEVARLREARLAEEAVIREQKIIKKISDYEAQQKQFLEDFDAHIRKEKEAAKSFVTAENIDEAIEAALSTVVDHNFAIDTQGNVFKGRYGKPAPSPGSKPTQQKPLDTHESDVSLQAQN